MLLVSPSLDQVIAPAYAVPKVRERHAVEDCAPLPPPQHEDHHNRVYGLVIIDDAKGFLPLPALCLVKGTVLTPRMGSVHEGYVRVDGVICWLTLA